jgi:hypothetical protein
MDFDKLIEPYIENGRTVGGQIKWLQKYASQDSIDYAMTSVYKRLEIGEKFEDGNALDQEIRRIALEHHAKDVEEKFKTKTNELQSSLDVEWNKLNKFQKLCQVITGKA